MSTNQTYPIANFSCDDYFKLRLKVGSGRSGDDFYLHFTCAGRSPNDEGEYRFPVLLVKRFNSIWADLGEHGDESFYKNDWESEYLFYEVSFKAMQGAINDTISVLAEDDQCKLTELYSSWAFTSAPESFY